MSVIYKLSDGIIASIKPYIKNKSDDDLEIAKYGLNLFLMELYKFPILFGIAYYLGILKYCLLSYILFVVLRNCANGIHLKSGRGCLFYSCIALFSIVYISQHVIIHWVLKLFISLITIYLLYNYAPADTEARPLLNKDTRKKKKKVSIFMGIIYLSLSFILSDKVISNIFLLVLILQCVIIHPITYKIFNRRYNNYEYF